MTQLRDQIKVMSPPWLASGTAEKYMYNIGLAGDALLEKMNQGTKARMPTLCDESALPILGTDRLLTQAPNETNASFRVRLQEAFDTWARAGSREAVIDQVVTFLSGTTAFPGVVPLVGIVGGNLSKSWDVEYNNGQRFHVDLPSQNWDWDGSNQWWRCWLILYMSPNPTGNSGTVASIDSIADGWKVTVSGLSGMTTSSIGNILEISGTASGGNSGDFQIVDYVSASSVVIANRAGVAPDANNGAITWTEGHYPSIGPAPVWGAPNATWGDPTVSWGLNVPSTTIEGIRSLVRLWKRASAYYRNIIVCFGGLAGQVGAEFSPYSSEGSGNPDGTWGPISANIGGVMSMTRLTGSQLGAFDAYCGGSGSRVNCTVENVT